MSTATSGRRREHQVRDHLTDHGWHLIARSAGSKGPADLVMAHLEHGAALIQVGTVNKSLGPLDRDRLLFAAELCSALPIVAQVIATPGKPTRIAYWRVTAAVPSRWDRWSPGYRCTSCGDLVPVLVADTEVCVRCDGRAG